MFELIRILKEWQELIGAIIGAIGALMVAFIVAGSEQRRSERIAAMAITGLLVDFLGLVVKLEDEWQRIPNKQGLMKDDWVGQRVLWMWPGMPPEFDSLRMVLCDADEMIAIHLTLLSQIIRSMNDVKSKFDRASGNATELAVLRPQHAKFRVGLEEGGPHAYAAIRIIERYVLSKKWRWHRFLRVFRIGRFSQDEMTRKYKELKPNGPWPK